MTLSGSRRPVAGHSDRRCFLQRTSAAAMGALLTSGLWPLTAAQRALAAGGSLLARALRVQDVKRTTLRLPYRDVPRRAMDRELPHWRYTEICEVTLAGGVVGIGETLLYYTWGVPSDDAVRRVVGKSAAELMWDDSLGAGLQQAMFDAVAKTLEVPLHQLLGPQIHTQTPLSWWNIDMPPEDMARECAEAFQNGYLSYKTKGRPWFDLWEQVAAVSRVVPEHFKLDMDYNDTLLDAERAIPILKELEQNPRIDIYETPIPQQDVEGNRRITEATRVNVALHYGTPDPKTVVDRQVCDGFVIGGGASRVLRQGRFAEEVEMPFWLQLVGTDITAAFSLHFGAALAMARWPAVNCHQLYAVPLLERPIPVQNGLADVPDSPGLGFHLNRDIMERYRVEKPAKRPDPPRLIETSWDDGRVMYTANDGEVNFMLRAGIAGKYPYFKRGVQTRLIPHDGSQAWRVRYERARAEPFLQE